MLIFEKQNDPAKIDYSIYSAAPISEDVHFVGCSSKVIDYLFTFFFDFLHEYLHNISRGF